LGKILRGNSLIYLLTLISVVFVDLFTKKIAEEYFSTKSYEPLPFLKLFLIYNRGAAFGIFADSPDWLRIPLLLIIPIIAFVVTYVYARRSSEMKNAFIMGLIGGGALGNLHDRILFGKVRDFLHLHIGEFYWPAFNLADVSITTALILFIYRSLKR